MRSEQKAKLRPSWIRPLRFAYLVVPHQFADQTSDFFVRFLSLRIVNRMPFAIRHPTKAFQDAKKSSPFSQAIFRARFAKVRP